MSNVAELGQTNLDLPEDGYRLRLSHDPQRLSLQYLTFQNETTHTIEPA